MKEHRMKKQEKMKMSNPYYLTDDELNEINHSFKSHLSAQNSLDNSGFYKVPRHWIKIQIFSPPRSGVMYKGFVCNCGFEFYLMEGNK